VKKFTAALKAVPPRRWPQLDDFTKVVEQKYGGLIVDRSEDVSILTSRGSPSKRKPSRGLRSVPQDYDNLGDAEVLVTSDWGLNITSKYSDLFGPVFKGVNLHPIRPIMWADKEIDPYQVIGGKIAFIQEAGGKLRSVASPFLAYQHALRHFGKAVYWLASLLPWDCTHDQSKPVHTLMDSLRRGSTVHSVDLSSATDYFPLEVQVAVMKALYGNISDIGLFETLSRSTWFSPLGPIRWNRGQPLGLYPSFAVFTVTHGLLLWYLNGCRWNKEFFVLGDDVVIVNDDLYKRYIETLEEWNCPYSPDKSISSNQICEFAGKVITSKSVTSQYKWREMSNDNFVDIARQLGQRSRILLSKKQREVFDIIKHCATPLGLGFSYPGSSVIDLEENSISTFGVGKEAILDSMVDQAGVIFKNQYGSEYDTTGRLIQSTTVSFSVAQQMIAALDKRARLVLSKLLPWFHSDMDPRLYSGVPGALGNTELPPVQLLPSRRTALDRYRQLLNLGN
jgi:hypothetical protein